MPVFDQDSTRPRSSFAGEKTLSLRLTTPWKPLEESLNMHYLHRQYTIPIGGFEK